MDSSLLEGIYARWNNLLCQLNVEIRWIEGSRNEIADALSRTILNDPVVIRDEELEKRGQIETDKNGLLEWAWEDGKGGYRDLIKERRKQEVLARTNEILGLDPESSSVESVEARLVMIVSA